MIRAIHRRCQVRILAVALACFLIGAGSHVRAVVCYGADGHVALESASGARCDELAGVSAARGAETPSEAFSSTDTDHCGPCADVPAFVNSQLFPAKNPCQPDLLSVLAGSADCAPVFSPLSCDDLRPIPPAERSQTLASLRTVILLI